jgi:hypothetical protein
MSASHAAIAATLDEVGDHLSRTPDLDPDGALRLAIWGTPDTARPVGNTADTALFDEVEPLIEGYDAARHGYECGDGIAGIDRDAAIVACRAVAARIRSYG